MHPSQWAERRPRHAAIVSAADGEVRDYAALEHASNRSAHLLRQIGLRRGDRIALWCDTRPDALEIGWAAERAGLLFVPVSTRLTAAEAGHVIADCDARLIVAGPSV